MKVILTMAISANGIIATKDGSEDFLPHDNWIQFVKLAKRVGCFIWGRKTYEAVLKWEGDYLDDLKNVTKVIISRSDLKLNEGFVLAHSPEDALKKLREKGFAKAIVTGGAKTNSEFAKRSLVDEVIFDVNPVVLGQGVPVFYPEVFELKLQLIESTKVSDDIIKLRYKVKK
ncbi:dihydrofolate reductase family protein [Patescibacteria group bacterium]